MPGSWEVTPAGAFTYTIPLQVPEGRNGMQPSLALSYSSSSRNGILGMGWSLTGLSTITRCDKTLATEGMVDGVDYSDFTTDAQESVDRFCLDGQKLVAIGGIDNGDGKYGGIDTEYRTESDIFARIVSTGAGANVPLGPDKFIVYLKSGIIREYLKRTGMHEQPSASLYNGVVTASATHLGQVPVAWLLSAERDRSGNEVRYSYLGSDDDPETRYLPTRISYTYNTQSSADALQAHRFVDFNYEVRPDSELFWKSGVVTKSTRRLTSIVMSAPNPALTSKVWEYDFSYDPSAGSGRSLLKSVKRCGALGGCTRAKQFDWSPSTAPTFTASTIAPAPANVEDPANAAGQSPGDPPTPMYSDLNVWVPPTTKVFDANGDGLDDVLYYPGQDGGPTPYFAQMRLGYRAAGVVNPLGHGFAAESALSPLLESSRIFLSRPVDIDGDGSVELWSRVIANNVCKLQPLHWDSQIPGFVAVNLGGQSHPCMLANGEDPVTDFADFNGDGLLDILGEQDLPSAGPEFYIQTNLGGNAFGPKGAPGLASSHGVRVTDLDGDGRADALVPGSVKSLSIDDAGWKTVQDMTGVAIVPGPGIHFGDFNGDGLEDVLFYEATGTTAAKILWNTGNGYVPDSGSIALPHDVGWQYGGVHHPFTDEGIRIQDVDGDGRSDIVSFHSLPTPDIAILYSNGTGAFTRVDLNADPGFLDAKGGWSSSQLGDFNGDGRPDIVTITNGNMVVLAQNARNADRLVTVTDEQTAWAREQINYSNEWSDRPDVKDQYSCAYPLRCVRHGFPVVRSVVSRAHLVDPSFTSIQVDGRTFYYSYEDPVSDLRGRGFLGFGTFHVWDPQRPMETITKFDQRTAENEIYPGAFHPKSVTTVVPILNPTELAASPLLATARVTRSEYTYTLSYLNFGKSHAVLPETSTTKEWEQDVTIDWSTFSSFNHLGVHVLGVLDNYTTPPLKVDTAKAFDAYGNLMTSFRWTAGGVQESIVNFYDYRPQDWLVGLPSSHCVEKTEDDPTQLPVTRCETYTHDTLGRLDTISIEAGNANPDIPLTTTVGYDNLGLSTSMTFVAAGVASRTAHVEYAPAFPGQPAERVFPSQIWAEHNVSAYRPSSWLSYHPGYGVSVEAMDVNGVQTQVKYDDLGRAISMRHDGDVEVTLSYSGRPDLGGGINGSITQIQNGLQTSKVITDALDRTISDSHTGFDGSMVETRQVYDKLGRVVQTDEPIHLGLTRTTLRTFDSLNRLIHTLLPDNNELVTNYPMMFVTQSFDANNNETDVTRDVNGRVIISDSILDIPAQDKIKTRYEYAPFDQLARVTDAQGNVTTMHYDVRGRQIQLDDPDQGTTTFKYNGFGNLYRSTHTASGQVKNYQRDDLGRLTGITDPDGQTSFVWDSSPFGIGRLASTLSPDQIATQHRYDSAGRVAGVDLFDDQNVEYSTDIAYAPTGSPLSGKPLTLSYPNVPGRSRFAVQNSYNNSGYIEKISGLVTPGQSYEALWGVSARNRDMALLHGSLGSQGQIDVIHGYEDLTSRISSLQVAPAASGSNAVVDLEYRYQPNGLVDRRLDHAINRDEGFTYDSLLRLNSWSLYNDKSSLITEYSYDTIGNLLEVDEDSHPVEVNTYGNNGAQPHTLTDHHDVVNNQHDIYAYDSLGRQSSGGGRTMVHSAFDLPKTVTKNGDTWTLLYDAFGHRVKKSGPDGTTLYVGGLYERRERAGDVQHVFHVDGTDGPVAEVIFDGTTTTPSYVVSDPLGSTSVVLNDQGAVREQFFFQPFGKRINADGTAFSGVAGPMKNGFTGQESDDAFGLINFQGRMYDPALKRFTSADPHVTYPEFGQSWNPYSYVLNSPLNFADPSGLDPKNEICTSLGQCYPTDDGSGGGGGGDSGGGSGYQAPFNETPGSGGGGGGGRDVERSDGSGSRQLAESTAGVALGVDALGAAGASAAGSTTGVALMRAAFLLARYLGPVAAGVGVITYDGGNPTVDETGGCYNGNCPEATKAAVAAAAAAAAAATATATAPTGTAAGTTAGTTTDVPPRSITLFLHRNGGGSIANLQLSPQDLTGTPMGLSVILAATPMEAANEMRRAFPKKTNRIYQQSIVTGSITIDEVRKAGFVPVPSPSRKLPNHWVITHPAGEAGFTPENIAKLSSFFINLPTPG